MIVIITLWQDRASVFTFSMQELFETQKFLLWLVNEWLITFINSNNNDFLINYISMNYEKNHFPRLNFFKLIKICKSC